MFASDRAAIADRITEQLRLRGWSARELGRRTWGRDDARAGNAIAGLRKGVRVDADTLSDIARTLEVSVEWLVYGRGEHPAAPRATPALEPAPTPPTTEHEPPRDPVDLPPGCLAKGKNYVPRKTTAKRLAPDVPEPWVWDDLDTVDALFLGTREPSPQVLADLARLIQKHGKPR